MKYAIIMAMGTLGASLCAEEITLKKAPLKLDLTVDVQAIPATFHSISLVTEKWKELTVEQVVPQGKKVKAGEVLVQLDTEGLEKEIAKQKKEQISRELNLEAMQQEYDELVESTKNGIAKSKRTFERKKEDHDYALKVTIPEAAKNSDQMLENSKHSLEYAEEEFNQLKKMYAEDDLTEETEEIILKRTKRMVERGQRGVDAMKRENNWTKNVKLKRDKQDWADALRDAKAAHKSEVKKLQRALKQKKEVLDKEKKTISDWKEHIASLETDLELMQITSPADGVVYYGDFEKGFWNSVAAQKSMVKGGKIISKAPFLTVVPTEHKLEFVGFVGAKERGFINRGDNAQAKFHGTFAKTNLKVAKVAESASLGGKWRVDLTGTPASGSFIQAGTAAKANVISVDLPNALAVPHHAVSVDDSGKATVTVKLADGKTEKREVKLGSVTDTKVQIRKGVQEGQVVVTP